MGLEESKAEVIKDNWEPIGEILEDSPGTPTLVRSILRPHMVAELYEIEMDNTNIQQQIATYKERRINSHNILGLYDFQVTKAFLGCARNASLYKIIIERIPYRLSDFSHLEAPQIIYIFHQALNGYNELAKYRRVCYPAADMIGIKENGEVKVWSNCNWAQNSFRRAKNESSSIYSLWSSIKMRCSNPDSLKEINSEMNKLAPVQFQTIINLLRINSSRQILEGKFRLERRIKNKQFTETQPKVEEDENMQRPRAFSENLRRPQTPYALPFNRNDPSLRNSPVYFHHFTERPNQQPRPPRPMSVQKVYESKIYQKKIHNPLKSSQVEKSPINFSFVNSNSSPQKKPPVYQQIHRSSFLFTSPTPVTFENRVAGVKETKEVEQRSSGKVQFSYERSEKKASPEIHIHQNGFMKGMGVNAWNNDGMLNKNRIVAQIPPNEINNFSKNKTLPEGVYFEQRKTRKVHIGKQTVIEPFELELKLENVIAKQGNRQTFQTYREIEERPHHSLSHASPIRMYSSGQSVNFQQKEPELPIQTDRETRIMQTDRDQLTNSNSKQVAEQFKYYLRESKEEEEEEIEQFALHAPREKDQTEQLIGFPKMLTIPEKQREIMDAQSNSRCIIERWEEQESSFYS